MRVLRSFRQKIYEKQSLWDRLRREKNGNYQVALKSCGEINGSTYKRIIDTNINYILNKDMEMYLIPESKFSNSTTLNLCDKYKQYIVYL